MGVGTVDEQPTFLLEEGDPAFTKSIFVVDQKLAGEPAKGSLLDWRGLTNSFFLCATIVVGFTLL